MDLGFGDDDDEEEEEGDDACGGVGRDGHDDAEQRGDLKVESSSRCLVEKLSEGVSLGQYQASSLSVDTTSRTGTGAAAAAEEGGPASGAVVISPLAAEFEASAGIRTDNAQVKVRVNGGDNAQVDAGVGAQASALNLLSPRELAELRELDAKLSEEGDAKLGDRQRKRRDALMVKSGSGDR
mmetsp:Transcript_56711/g.97691  ORF Transcript_56711/g.97691 Transcript_56711/m.97691 type:complete len:182 (-) Transcript_56711:173-718(-)